MCDDDVMFCSNCKREIPQGNFVMHNVHCQRKLALCMKCDEPVPRSELAAHNANYHTVVECPACGHQCEKRDLADHQSSSCSRRAICCNYCHIETEASELAEHENYCGSRTERCDECGEFVMLKYQQLHQDSNHGFLKLEDEPGPAPSWTNTRSSSSLLNDLSRQRKVSNASQDSVRPTSASNRLSPSKRTNDMPQINSATTSTTTKDLHKKSIPSDDTGVDLDRLLAIRLAEQERERAMKSVSSTPYEVDLGIPTQSQGELVALPCEFCHAMIPANQLVVHETGCRPDLACYKTKELPVNRHRKLSSSSDEEDNDGLPCEFCGALFPPQYLLQHQAICDISTNQDGNLKNELGSSSQSKNHTPKKLLNLGPDSNRLFPIPSLDHGDDKNQYLEEMRAALKKPTASIRPVGRRYSSGSENAQNDIGPASHRSYITSPGCTNGVTRLPSSTGAVPKQKAGRRVNTHEVSQEVPRPSSSSVTFNGQLRYRNLDGNR